MTPTPSDDFDEDELAPWEQSSSGPQLLTVAAGDVTPTKPEWVIEGWVLRRALNLIVGRQGAGKTTLAAYLVACVTTDRTFPSDEPRPPMRAAVLSLEEPDDRIVARLKAAGAELQRVVLFGDVQDHDDDGRPYRRRWQLPRDVGALGKAIEDHNIDVVVVDGLGFSIAGDSHNYATVGSALAALAAEADRTDTAVIGLTHPPKGASDPVTAAIGSTAWTSIPRISIVLGVDPEDETRRVARVAKTNYKEPPAGVSFILGSDEELEVGYVASIRLSNVTAEQLTAAPASAEEKGERAEAREFLHEHLADGPLRAEDVVKAAGAAGISKRTLERARRDVGVVASRRADPQTGRMVGWLLALPGQDATPPTSPPAPETWRSGRSGQQQELHSVRRPDRHTAKVGGVDDSLEDAPFYARDEF